MGVQVEKLEKNMAKLTIEVSAEEFEAALEKAYQKNKGKITLPGFRKGKAPRKMIEKMYSYIQNKKFDEAEELADILDKKSNGYVEGISKARVLISRGRRHEKNS